MTWKELDLEAGISGTAREMLERDGHYDELLFRCEYLRIVTGDLLLIGYRSTVDRINRSLMKMGQKAYSYDDI